MKRFWYLGYLAALALLCLTMLTGGYHPDSLLSYSFMIVAFGVSSLLLLALYRPADIARIFQSLVERRPASQADLQLAQAFFDTWQRLMVLLAPFSMVMGFIHVLEGLGQGDLHALGEGLAVAICGMWFCFATILFVTVPCLGAVRKKLAMLGKSASTT